MRITGGKFRGRILKTPKGDHVRPTQDCVREALFSILQGEIPGCCFLDLFAGTGAVGLEALSRGASDVTWVEANRATARLTSANVSTIAGDSAAFSVVSADVFHWIRSAGSSASFDIVFADPPYDLARPDGLSSLASLLTAHKVIAPNGILITEMPLDAPVSSLPGWTELRNRTYGKTRLVLRQFTSTSNESPLSIS